MADDSKRDLTEETEGDDALDPNYELDIPGMLGVLTGSAAALCLILGFMIPVIPWVLASLLGLLMLALGALSRSEMRKYIIWGGLVALIPSILFILVQSVPKLQDLF